MAIRDFLPVWDKIPFCGIVTDPAGRRVLTLHIHKVSPPLWNARYQERQLASAYWYQITLPLLAFVTDLMDLQNVTAQRH
jgi:hypothetical protein